MRIIAKRTLREFWEEHRECERPLEVWYKEVTRAKWENPSDVKRDYATASILRNGSGIKDNKFRLVANIRYDLQIVWILFIGTHGEYDEIDALNI
jgi:mRNA interferase HigB